MDTKKRGLSLASIWYFEVFDYLDNSNLYTENSRYQRERA